MGVFKNSDLYHALQTNSLNIPKPVPFPKTGDPIWDEDEYPRIPYVIVGDDAFQLSEFMMKPMMKVEFIITEFLDFGVVVKTVLEYLLHDFDYSYQELI